MIFWFCLLSFVYQTFAVCKYLYDTDVPVPLDYCHYNTPYYSYGSYCVTNYNNSGIDEVTVLEVYFNVSDCPDGIDGTWQLYKTFNCTELGDECNCDGNINECKLTTKRISDYSYIVGCNETFWTEITNAWDVCIGVGDFGGRYINCDHDNGVGAEWYHNADCSGGLKPTSAPVTPSPLRTECVTIDCGLSAEEDGGMDAKIIVVIVAVVLICCIGIIAVVIFLKKRGKGTQYFDEKKETGKNEDDYL